MHSLEAVNEIIELGKDGHKIIGSNSTHVEIKNTADVLIPVKGADATASDEFVTQSQLDSVATGIGGFQSHSYDATGALTQLDGQGSGTAGAIRKNDIFKVGVAGTVIGVAVNVGDRLVASIAGADTSDNTASNSDWFIDDFKQASDLSDGVSTDNSAGKIIVKDSGITTDKLADANVTLAKMAANSVDSDQYVDRSIDGVHIAVGSLLDEHHATGVITQAKLNSVVSLKINHGQSTYDTRTPNLASAIQAGFDPDSDSSITGQTHYMTNTTVSGQLAQADEQFDKRDARHVSATHSGGSQNIASSIDSGRIITAIHIRPLTVANGANCTMTIGIAGDTAKYVAAVDIDLYDSQNQPFFINRILGSNEQLIATVTQGTATQGTFLVTVEHV